MKEFTCIVCPKGCNLIYHDDGTVTGNTCDRGKSYAISEATNPVRFVTSTVSCDNGMRCPVRTSAPVSKNRMMDIMKVIRNTHITIHVEVGEIITANIAGSGADLIATSSLSE